MKAIRFYLAPLACLYAVGCASGGGLGTQNSQTKGTDAVTNPQAITAVTANITWNTNQPATSEVEYGTTTAYANVSPANSSLTTAHSVTLTGLSRNTQYHYRVVSVNSSGVETHSGDLTFETK